MDYAKKHTTQLPGKGLGSKPEGGANQMPGKDHAASIALGEGLGMGKVQSSHTKMSVPTKAPVNTKVRNKAHGFNQRSEAGNAETMGGDCE